MEYLVTMTTHVPEGTSEQVLKEATAGEAERTRELAGQGHLIRLWAVAPQAGAPAAFGLWLAVDAAQMQAILESLPLYPYLTTGLTPLTPHPSDPAIPGSRLAVGHAQMGADRG